MKGNQRNEPCPCGSGIKAKKCCHGVKKHEEQRQADIKAAAEWQAEMERRRLLGRSRTPKLNTALTIAALVSGGKF